MRLRSWLAVALLVGTLGSTLALAAGDTPPAKDQPAAQQLPKVCVDAGIASEADCKTLIAGHRAAAKKAAAEKAAAEKAAEQPGADKAAAAEAEAKKLEAGKAAADKAAAEKAAAERAGAAAAAAKEAAAKKIAVDKAALDQAAADKAAADQAASIKAAAAKAATEDASAKKAAAAKVAADKAAADQAVSDKAAADQAAADAAAAKKAAALKAALDKREAAKAAAEKADAAAASPPAADEPVTKPKLKSQAAKLAQDCLDAKLTSQADCDALHAIASQKGTPKPPAQAKENAPAKVAPAEAVTGAPSAVDPSGKLPAEVTPTQPAAATVAATPPAAAPSLPDIAKGLNAAAKAYNRGVAVLGKAGSDPVLAGKAHARIDAAQAEIDTLCKSNKFGSTGQCLAQFAIELLPLPAASGGPKVVAAPVQPVETIDALPKGVGKEAVAPLLDSAKDQKTGKGVAQPAGQPPAAIEPPALASAPPPKSDKAAQAGLKTEIVAPIDRQKGQQLDPAAVAQIQVPRNVTIVNQTVNNNTTNNTQIINNPKAPASGVQGSEPGRRDQARRGGPPDNPIGLGIGIVLQLGNQLIVSSPAEDQRRIAYHDEDRTSYERLPNERFRETILRPDGVRIVTVYNRNGDILRRSRIGPDGREIVLAYFDDSHDRDLLEWHDPGEDLPPLRLRIPARDYVLDADRADRGRVRQFFAQPPVEPVRRLYSIAEVKRSSRIRDMVRRLEIGNLTFNSGAATISREQVGNLSNVAGAMLLLLQRNPAETFLIEGHTDAVGSDIANLQLSDERAATVARVLTDFYDVPPENLATQGYGERYLKVETDLPERLNRRVTIRRITSLVTMSKY